MNIFFNLICIILYILELSILCSFILKYYFYRPDYKNACIVSSVDRTLGFFLDPKRRGKDQRRYIRRGLDMKPDVESSDYPFDLLGEEGFRTMNPFVPIEMTNYSDGELDVMIDYFTDKRLDYVFNREQL